MVPVRGRLIFCRRVALCTDRIRGRPEAALRESRQSLQLSRLVDLSFLCASDRARSFGVPAYVTFATDHVVGFSDEPAAPANNCG